MNISIKQEKCLLDFFHFSLKQLLASTFGGTDSRLSVKCEMASYNHLKMPAHFSWCAVIDLNKEVQDVRGEPNSLHTAVENSTYFVNSFTAISNFFRLSYIFGLDVLIFYGLASLAHVLPGILLTSFSILFSARFISHLINLLTILFGCEPFQKLIYSQMNQFAFSLLAKTL